MSLNEDNKFFLFFRTSRYDTLQSQVFATIYDAINFLNTMAGDPSLVFTLVEGKQIIPNKVEVVMKFTVP